MPSAELPVPKKAKKALTPARLREKATDFISPVPNPLPFAQNAPTSHTKAAVTKFINKTEMDKTQKSTLLKAISEVSAQLKELSANTWQIEQLSLDFPCLTVSRPNMRTYTRCFCLQQPCLSD